ncbi:hypothetical protein FHX82_003843 [Amycolatopsis bartoniae]|uniref:Trypsin-co-occurring domain-containing protein n=1 Tax=Amycolatopsis bartoniae TaxID=941986 RepID=A0A8H9M9L5_9PSEU|nr:CU044_2847 family protein [Amycolatopsis bartoniae]MBB2936779.1 hypothetical protein [Amycolatopsis bartoniae]TVT09173.1 hypothetical protein FNH07_09750 [Amycolatopsis bartoniae]GHF50067.1 hypothetical protein GCM10017566_23940 [Amycolatopsis bartoniae]
MAGRLERMRFGGVDVLVETVPVPGSEPTSRLSDAGGRAVDLLETAQEVIVSTARSTAEMFGRLENAVSPDKLEIEFGLGFSAKGNIIVAGGSLDATVKVKLTYEAGPRA